MRTELLASSQSCHSIDSDALCKRALKALIENCELFTVLPLIFQYPMFSSSIMANVFLVFISVYHAQALYRKYQLIIAIASSFLERFNFCHAFISVVFCCVYFLLKRNKVYRLC